MKIVNEKQMELRLLDEKQMELMAAIEAILFTMGDSVEISKIAQAIGQTEKETRKLVESLMEKYQEPTSGLKIVELENSFQMCSKGEMYDYLIQIASQPKKHVLTDVLMETLSIIAYKQPITRTEIENIRGVKCDHAVNKLIEYNLVTELGRLDAPGRPLLFGTTEEFLRKFGVTSIADLPTLDGDKVSEFKVEAEKEIGYVGETAEESETSGEENEISQEENGGDLENAE